MLSAAAATIDEARGMDTAHNGSERSVARSREGTQCPNVLTSQRATPDMIARTSDHARYARDPSVPQRV